MEHRKSRESNIVVRMLEGIPVGRIKLQKSNPVVCTVSYSNIMRVKILPSYLIKSHNLYKIKVASVLLLCT